MRATCCHCQSQYDIDDSKVPGKRAAIRCSQCQQVFEYVKPQETESFWQPPDLTDQPSESEPENAAEPAALPSAFEQMQTLQTETAEESVEPVEAESHDDADLLASLEAEKAKVTQESQRLEQVNARMDALTDSGSPAAVPPAKAVDTAYSVIGGDDSNNELKVAEQPLDLGEPMEVDAPEPHKRELPAQDKPAPVSPGPQRVATPTQQIEKKLSYAPWMALMLSSSLFFVTVGILALFYIYKRSQAVQPAFDTPVVAAAAQTATTLTQPEVNAVDRVPIATPVDSPSEPVTGKSAFELGMAAYHQHSLAAYRRAESHLLEAYKQEERSPRTVTALSQLYAVLGHHLDREKLLKRSLNLAQRVLQHHAEQGFAHRAMAQAYFYAGKHSQAFEHVQKALALADDDKEAYLLRGMILWKLGKGGGGLQQAYKMAPQSFLPLDRLTAYYLESKKFKNAYKHAAKLMARFPARYEGYYYGMQAAEALGKRQRAESFGEQALLLNPTDSLLNQAVAKLYLDHSKDEKAAELLEEFLAQVEKLKRDELIKIYILVGKALLKSKPRKAQFYFDKVVGWEKEHATALNYLGLAHFNQKNYKDSIRYFSAAHKQHPDNTQITYNLALSYFHASQFRQAEELFSQVVRSNPRHEEANLFLASVFEKQGNRIKAIAGLQRVLQINPRNQVARQKVKRLKAGY